MTGRDLIIYILANGLEDEKIFGDGKLIGFETESAFAERMNVGVATVQAWISMGTLKAIRIGDENYIPINSFFPNSHK